MIRFRIVDLPDQEFSLILERRRVTLRVRYNPSIDRWALSVSIDDTPVVRGRIIVLDRDLLRPFSLGLGTIFAAPTREGVEPTRDALINGDVRLYYATVEEKAALMAEAA